MSNINWRLVAAFATVYVVWGSTYLAIHFAIQTIPPFLMAGFRYFTAGLLLYTFLRLRGTPAPESVHWKSAALIGALLLFGGNGGVTWAEQRVPSGLAALLIAMVPLWMVLLDWLKNGVRPTGWMWSGLTLGFIGLALLAGPGSFAGGQSIDPVGTAVLVLAALSWSTGSILSRSVSLPSAPLLATAMEMLAGGLVMILVGLAFGEASRLDLAAVTPRSFLAFGYLVFFGSIVGFSAYVWLLRNAPPARVATYAYVNPVVAVLLGWLFAEETLAPRTLLAATIIVTAVALITIQRTRSAPPVEPPVDPASEPVTATSRVA